VVEEEGTLRIKQSAASTVFDIVNVFLMILLIIVMIYPMVYVFSASISSEALVQSGAVKLFPKGVSFAAYEKLIFSGRMWNAYWNTLRYTVMQTAITLVLTSMLAYPLAKKFLPGRRTILLLAAFTMLFSGGLIPTFLVVKNLGLLNSIWAIVLPTAINTWYLFIMRTFFEALPQEIEEAAIIDGCGFFQVLWRIVLPLCIPVMVSIGLFTAVGQWNAFFDSLIYLKEQSKYPLQILLRELVIAGAAMEGEGDGQVLVTSKYSTIIFATVPILCLYPFLQKYFVQGTMIGGVKG